MIRQAAAVEYHTNWFCLASLAKSSRDASSMILPARNASAWALLINWLPLWKGILTPSLRTPREGKSSYHSPTCLMRAGTQRARLGRQLWLFNSLKVALGTSASRCLKPSTGSPGSPSPTNRYVYSNMSLRIMEAYTYETQEFTT